MNDDALTGDLATTALHALVRAGHSASLDATVQGSEVAWRLSGTHDGDAEALVAVADALGLELVIGAATGRFTLYRKPGRGLRSAPHPA